MDASPLEQAIAQLHRFRDVLGDTAVDEAIGALRRYAPTRAPIGAASASSPVATRLRQVSVLFADVADSTAMLGRVANGGDLTRSVNVAHR